MIFADKNNSILRNILNQEFNIKHIGILVEFCVFEENL